MLTSAFLVVVGFGKGRSLFLIVTFISDTRSTIKNKHFTIPGRAKPLNNIAISSISGGLTGGVSALLVGEFILVVFVESQIYMFSFIVRKNLD